MLASAHGAGRRCQIPRMYMSQDRTMPLYTHVVRRRWECRLVYMSQSYICIYFQIKGFIFIYSDSILWLDSCFYVVRHFILEISELIVVCFMLKLGQWLFALYYILCLIFGNSFDFIMQVNIYYALTYH